MTVCVGGIFCWVFFFFEEDRVGSLEYGRERFWNRCYDAETEVFQQPDKMHL